jgi:hypothetical protein
VAQWRDIPSLSFVITDKFNEQMSNFKSIPLCGQTKYEPSLIRFPMIRLSIPNKWKVKYLDTLLPIEISDSAEPFNIRKKWLITF